MDSQPSPTVRNGAAFPSTLSSHYPVLAAGSLPAVVFVILLARAPRIDLTLTSTGVWIVTLGLFVLAALLKNDPQQDFPTTFINFPTVVVWLALGLAPALSVLLLGVTTAALLRYALAGVLKLRAVSLRSCLHFGFEQSAHSGLPLLATALLYAVLDGRLPLRDLESGDILPLVVALAGGFAASRLLDVLLAPGSTQRKMSAKWLSGQWSQLLVEILALPLSVALALVVYSASVAVFAIIVLLIGAQALRQYQLGREKRALAQRLQELSLLNDLSRKFSEHLALADLLSHLYQLISAAIPASVFFVALFEEHTQTLAFRAVHVNRKAAHWPARKLGAGPLARTIREKQLLHLSAEQFKQFDVIDFDLDGADGQNRAFIGLPLVVGATVAGAIGLLSNEQRDFFPPDDVIWLGRIADLSALAVHNALVYTRSAGLIENLSLINQTVRDVLFNLDSEEALRVGCQTVVKLAAAGKAAIFTLDVEQQQFHLAQSVGLTEAHRRLVERQPAAFASSEIRLIPDVGEHEQDTALLELANAGDFRAFAVIPLRSGNMVIGAVAVYHDEPHYYSQTTLDMLETFANLITAMLDNSQLFHALEVYAFEMTQLANLSRTATSSLQLQAVVDEVAKIFSQMMNVDRVVVAALLPNENRFKILGAVKQENQNAITILRFNEPALPHFPELDALISAAVPEARAFQREDPYLSAELASLMAENGESSLALVPIVMESELLGVVLLGNRASRHFTSREWYTIEAATNQIAAQVHNAQLFERTQHALNQRLEELSLIENIARQISSELDVSQIIANVLDAAMRTTQADMAGLAMLTEANEFLVLSRQRDGEAIQRYLDFNKPDSGILGKALREKKVIIIADNRDDPDYLAPHFANRRYLSSIAIPLLKDSKVVGVLNLESVEADFFKEEQAGFLKNLGDHAIISMENARLLEERQYRIDMLTKLRNMTLQLSSTAESRAVAETVLKTALSLVQGSVGSFFRYDEASGQVDLLAGVLSRGRNNSGIGPGTLADVAMAAARQGEAHVVRRRQKITGQNVPGSIVAVPIKRDRQVREVLCIGFADGRRLQRRELNTLELLVSQAAGHLENATLHERIRAGNNRMRAILDSTRDGVILLDRNGRLVEANPSSERLLGINLEESVGEPLWTILLKYAQEHEDGFQGQTHDDVMGLARLLRLEPEGITRREFVRQLPDRTLYLEEVGSPVWDAHHQVVGRLLTLRDITEEKELEAYRDEIMSMVVHDLRGPLSSIVSSVAFAADNFKNEEDITAVEQMLKAALQSTNRLIGLVNSLLDINRLEKGQLPLNPEPVSVRHLIKSALESLEGVLARAQITVEIDVPENLPSVYVDDELIRRVLVNMLDNAERHTPEKSKIRVSASQAPNRRQVIIRVADSGAGIPPDQRKRIFEKFTQIKGQVALRGSRGSGLGLNFSKLAIEAHGGRIWVDDGCELPGACFAITLPMMIIEETA